MKNSGYRPRWRPVCGYTALLYSHLTETHRVWACLEVPDELHALVYFSGWKNFLVPKNLKKFLNVRGTAAYHPETNPVALRPSVAEIWVFEFLPRWRHSCQSQSMTGDNSAPAGRRTLEFGLPWVAPTCSFIRGEFQDPETSRPENAWKLYRTRGFVPTNLNVETAALYDHRVRS